MRCIRQCCKNITSYWPFLHRYTFEGPDLTIANVAPDDEGVYTCQIITKLDMAEAKGRLTLCGQTIYPEGERWPSCTRSSDFMKFFFYSSPFRSSGSSRLSSDKWCEASHRQPEMDPRRRPQQRRARLSKPNAPWLEERNSANTVSHFICFPCRGCFAL